LALELKYIVIHHFAGMVKSRQNQASQKQLFAFGRESGEGQRGGE